MWRRRRIRWMKRRGRGKGRNDKERGQCVVHDERRDSEIHLAIKLWYSILNRGCTRVFLKRRMGQARIGSGLDKTSPGLDLTDP